MAIPDHDFYPGPGLICYHGWSPYGL